MDRVLIEREIAQILAKMGIRANRPADRLLQDLGIDGDDAAEFFDAIHNRFGTDLTLLREDWDTHFGPEGLSIAPIGKLVAAAACVGVPAMLTGLPILLCGVLAAAGAAGAWMIPRSNNAPSRPIRLIQVSDAVERGRWQRPNE